MSRHESKTVNFLTQTGRVRRHFLKRTALTAIGAGAGAMFPPAHAKTTANDTAASNCRHVRTPLSDVDGKVAFITGGSSGIGLGMARAFTDAGMKVVIGYRTKSHLDEAMKYLAPVVERVHAISVDVTDRDAMEKAADETVRVFGKVHLLVNNAGVFIPEPLSETTYDDWDWVIGVNLNGAFNGVHSFLPHIQAHGEGGHIVTTSSILGLFVISGLGAYSPAKFALVGMMEALRAELADKNIGASVYCPGVVYGSEGQNSSRNRPKNLSDTHYNPDPKVVQEMIRSQRDPQMAMDPLEAGQLVLRGIRNNDLYILTHPEFEKAVRDRGEALNASSPRSTTGRAGFPPASIYVEERERKLCGLSRRTARRL